MGYITYSTKDDTCLITSITAFICDTAPHSQGLEHKATAIQKAQSYKPNAVKPNYEVVVPGARETVFLMLDFL